jgi:hypothetical protein
MVNDLPGGEKRLIQRALGVKMTMVNGEVLVEEGEHTGAFPVGCWETEDSERIFEFLV